MRVTLILCCSYKVRVASSFIAAVPLVKYKSSLSHFLLAHSLHLHVAETVVKKKELNFQTDLVPRLIGDVFFLVFLDRYHGLS